MAILSLSVIVVGGGKRQEEPKARIAVEFATKRRRISISAKKVAAKNWLGFYLAVIKGALVGVG